MVEMILSNEDKKFLKGLRKMTNVSDAEVKAIYILYRGLINKPEIMDEYKECNCPSLIRDMAFELTIWSLKNKQLLK